VTKSIWFWLLGASLFQGCYLTKQAFYQGKRFLSRRAVDEVLADTQVDSKIKTKLLQVQDMLTYAKSQGLRIENAYRTIILIKDREPVSYLVQGAQPYKLISKTWWFPIVGTVPYLGYFTPEERDQKASELKADGYDIYLSEAAAFSSLGWFEDPLFSSMLQRSRAHLADLIFHELTHRTFWAKDAATWNEQLASFVARKMTRSYLDHLGSPEAQIEKAQYEAWQEGRGRYAQWLEQLTQELKDLYESERPLSEMEILKQGIFSRYLGELKIQWNVSSFVGDEPWNNATVLAESLYNPEFERFDRSYTCSKAQTPGDFLKKIESHISTNQSVGQVLDLFCEETHP
jgi:predicted aminopeptidase